MATPAQIRNAVDDRLAQLWSTIQARQDSYHAAHGHYWQGLRTHTLAPADGNETAVDVGVRCPSDQLGEPWPTAIRNLSLPMSLQINCYAGPAGEGYEAVATVTIGASTWFRVAQVGPETHRTFGWRQERGANG